MQKNLLNLLQKKIFKKIKLVGEEIELQIFMTLKRKFEFSAYRDRNKVDIGGAPLLEEIRYIGKDLVKLKNA